MNIFSLIRLWLTTTSVQQVSMLTSFSSFKVACVQFLSASFSPSYEPHILNIQLIPGSRGQSTTKEDAEANKFRNTRHVFNVR